MATQNVFHNVELCTEILSHLDLLDLLRAQGVCTRFRDTITGSPTLQRQLFLKPAANKNIWLFRPIQATPIAGSSTFTDELYITIKAAVQISYEELKYHHGTVRTPVEANPAIFPPPLTLVDADKPIPHNTYLLLLPRFAQPDHADAESTSWYRMLMTQPPTDRVAVVSLAPRVSKSASRVFKHEEVRSETGVTVGDVVKAYDKITPFEADVKRTYECHILLRDTMWVLPKHEEIVREQTEKWRKEEAKKATAS